MIRLRVSASSFLSHNIQVKWSGCSVKMGQYKERTTQVIIVFSVQSNPINVVQEIES